MRPSYLHHEIRFLYGNSCWSVECFFGFFFFLPEDSLSLWVLPLPASVCVCVLYCLCVCVSNLSLSAWWIVTHFSQDHQIWTKVQNPWFNLQHQEAKIVLFVCRWSSHPQELLMAVLPNFTTPPRWATLWRSSSILWVGRLIKRNANNIYLCYIERST